MNRLFPMRFIPAFGVVGMPGARHHARGFTAVYGLAWLAGSTIGGALYSRSLETVTVFVVATQLVALIPFTMLFRLANYILHAVQHMSLASEHFMGIYLASHGLVKLGLVAALLVIVLTWHAYRYLRDSLAEARGPLGTRSR